MVRGHNHWIVYTTAGSCCASMTPLPASVLLDFHAGRVEAMAASPVDHFSALPVLTAPCAAGTTSGCLPLLPPLQQRGIRAELGTVIYEQAHYVALVSPASVVACSTAGPGRGPCR